MVWSANVVQQMVRDIERSGVRPFHEVFLRNNFISEYFLYGIYVDYVRGLDGLEPVDFPICFSIFDDVIPSVERMRSIAEKGDSSYFLVALQSASRLSIEERKRVLEQVALSVD